MLNKNILFITFEFPPYPGGAGVYAHDMAIGLCKNNCKVDVLTYNHNGIDKYKSELKFKYDVNLLTFKPMPILHYFQFAWHIKKQLKKNKYDMVILSDSSAKKILSLFGRFMPIDYAKTICVFHGNEINSFFKQPSLAIKLTRLQKKFATLLDKTHKIITVSEIEKDLWENEFPKWKSKIAMVKHGVSEDLFFKRSVDQKKALRKEFKLPQEFYIFFSASRLLKPKGQDMLLRAFVKVLQTHKDSLLLIAGDGPYLEDLKKQADSTGIKNNVLFLGQLDRKQLSNYYACSDSFVLVSRYEEAFGLVYLEAAACGLPCIAGNRGGVVNVIQDGVNGFVIDSLDELKLQTKLKLLIKDQHTHNKLAIAAHSIFLDNYTSKKASMRLINAVNSQ